VTDIREGNSFGQIDPVAPGIWRWPYRYMEPGDFFTVPENSRPSGAIRDHAYKEGRRLGKRFSVTSDGEETTVICLVPGEKKDMAGDLASTKAILVGGDGDKYLGVLQPPEHGRWSWPFATMEPGQYFHVNNEDRPGERTRALAMLRGAQLSMKMSVMANDPDKEGYCRITYVDAADDPTARDLSYPAFAKLMMRCYGIAPYQLGFEFLQDRIGERIVIRQYGIPDPKDHQKEILMPIVQVQKPRFESYALEDRVMSIAFELGEDEIAMTGLPKGMSHAGWRAGLAHDPFS
jgi:hypothetical protein